MDYLILAHFDDVLAQKLYLTLGHRHGKEHVRIVTDEELSLAQGWKHWIDSEVKTSFELGDGTRLDSDGIGVVFNRLRSVSMPYFQGATKANREYAQLEMYALLLSWLHGLPCVVVNRAAPQGLGSRDFSPYKWMVLAQRSGFNVLDYRFTTDSRRYLHRHHIPYRLESGLRYGAADRDSLQVTGKQPVAFFEPVEGECQRLLVVGDQVHGELADLFYDASQSLSSLSGCELLEIELCSAAGEWKVVSVSSFPQAHTQHEVDVIASQLKRYLDDRGMK